MERSEIGKRLHDLAQLDIDAVHAYEQAIERVGYDDIREKLRDFQDDHRRHIESLSAFLRDLDVKPPDSPDLKGYLIEGFTAIRSVTGTKGALEAMEGNEKLTNRKYGEASALDFPPEILKVVKSNLADEERHLGYIREILKTPRREL
jgi:uncharacterized protein (TIGR02284 family)